jgi:hypothetical protein
VLPAGDLVGGHVVDREHGEPVHRDPVLARCSPTVADVGEPDPGFPDADVLAAGVDEAGDGLAFVLELDLDVSGAVLALAVVRDDHAAEATSGE